MSGEALSSCLRQEGLCRPLMPVCIWKKKTVATTIGAYRFGAVAQPELRGRAASSMSVSGVGPHSKWR